jgi:hypothetical protein
MKLSNKTISILKSMTSVNIGMVIPAGNMLQVESTPRDQFVRCYIDEKFPIEVPIWDVTNFINTLNLFDNPDLDFQQDYVTISSGRNKCNYYYCSDKDFISHGDWLDIDDSSYVITFDLGAQDIANIQKASTTLALDQLEITNNKGNIQCDVTSQTKDTKNKYTIELGECDKSLDFNLVLRVAENFKFYDGDYQIRVANIKGTLVFCAKNTSVDLEYQIAMDRKSYFK